MNKNIPAAQLLLSELCERSQLGLVPKKSPKESTVVVPFTLTVPKPRKLPEPTVKIPTFVKANPVPLVVLKGSGEQEKLKNIKKINKEKALAKFQMAQKSQFAVASKKSLEILAETRKTILNAQLEEFKKSKPVLFRKVPPEIYSSVPVKLTAATILREEALVRKQKQKEEKLLRDVEIGLKDEHEFEEWRKELKLKEIEEKKLELEKRKLEIKLLHEETFIAKQEKLRENREKVAEALAEKQEIKELSSQFKQEIQEENKKRIEKVHEIKTGITEAKLKILDENTKAAAEMSLEYQAQKERAQQEAKEELEKRMELVKQIRLLEKSLTGNSRKEIDLTETSGCGILGEMSIIELQERLLRSKVKLKEAEESKRQEILAQKMARIALINSKMEVIDSERLKRREDRQKTFSRPVSCIPLGVEDDKLQKLKDVLEAKKAARLGLLSRSQSTISRSSSKASFS